MSEPFLSEIERNSALWKKLQELIEGRLVAMRRKNDGNLTHDQTMKLRGRIAELNNLLKLSAESPGIPDESSFE